VVVDLPESTWPITTTLMCIFSLLQQSLACCADAVAMRREAALPALDSPHDGGIEVCFLGAGSWFEVKAAAVSCEISRCPDSGNLTSRVSRCVGDRYADGFQKRVAGSASLSREGHQRTALASRR
jgi:hypothetical protein